jgi:O-antigen/teichoic acid export membrane protein
MTSVVRSVVVRLRPRDLGSLTRDTRSRERYKRVGLTALASIWATCVSIATGLVSIPLTFHYLGTEQYGLWVTITSVTALFGFANLGLSNGLVNGIADALGTDDRQLAARYVSSASIMLIGIAGLLGLGFAAVYPSVPWDDVFNTTSPDLAGTAGPAMAVLLALTLVSLPLGVVSGIQSGLQEGFANNIWRSVGSIISLIGLITAIAVGASLPWLVVALGGGAVAATLLNGIILFRRRAWLLPRVRLVTWTATRRMMRYGLLFFILSISGAVAYQTDNIVIARILGPADVAQYAIPMRLFLMAPLILGFALIPLWPAYGDALARGETAWIRRAFARSMGFSVVLGAFMSLGLLMLAVPILHAWVGGTINPSTSLLLGLACWAFLNCAYGPMAMLLNGANVLGFQVVCAVTMMTANLALSIALTKHIGLAGPVWGSVIAQVAFVILPSLVYTHFMLRRLSATTGADVRPLGKQVGHVKIGASLTSWVTRTSSND